MLDNRYGEIGGLVRHRDFTDLIGIIRPDKETTFYYFKEKKTLVIYLTNASNNYINTLVVCWRHKETTPKARLIS